jgi:hypothetical protein
MSKRYKSLKGVKKMAKLPLNRGNLDENMSNGIISIT